MLYLISSHGVPLAVSLYALVFVASVAQTALVPLLPALAAADHLSTASSAALIAAPGAATLAVALPAGALADRLGARRVTLWAGGLLAVGVVAQGSGGAGWLLAGRLAFGVAYGIVWTTAVAWIAEHEGDGEARARRQGAIVTSAASGVAAGPGFGALVGAHAGLGVPFLLTGLAAAAVTLALTTTPRRERAGAPESSAPSLAALPRAGRVLAAGALALALSGAVNAVVQLLVPLEMHRQGASTASIGLAFSGAAAVYIAVSALVVRLGQRAVAPRTNALAAVVLALALLPAGWSDTTVALLLTLVLTVAPRATLSTIAYPLATRDAARAGVGQGVAIGVLNAAWAAAMVAAPFAAGALGHWAGMRAAWLTTLALGLLAAGWLLAPHAARLRPGARFARA